MTGRSRTLIVAVALALWAQAGPTATPGTPAGCDKGFGTDVPVVFVHGFTGNGKAWDGVGKPTVDAVRGIKGAHVVRPFFDYEQYGTSWVTDEHIGPALARLVFCLARLSLLAGGRGEVIIVGHSMGGLAARYAASRDGGVADKIGLVVTIGTPHEGSPIADIVSPASTAGALGDEAQRAIWDMFLGLCVLNQSAACPFFKFGAEVATSPAAEAMRTGSKELADLPSLADELVPAYYIAGDLRLKTSWHGAGGLSDLHWDWVVDQSSAIPIEDSRSANSDVVSCDLDLLKLFKGKSELGFSCFHTELPGNSTVARDTADAIRAWLSANPLPERGATLPAAEEVRLDPANWDPTSSSWDAYGPTYEDNPLIGLLGSTHLHVYGSAAGQFTYHFDLAIAGGRTAQVSARLSSEFFGNSGPVDGFSDVTLVVNDRSYASQRVIPDNGSGEVYTWQIDPAGLLAGHNTISFIVSADAKYHNGLCIYQHSLIEGQEDAAIQVVVNP